MINLAQLQGERVTIELSINGRFTALTGVAHYGSDPTLGKVLRIRFPEEAGGMEILLEEDKWAGQIERTANDRPFTIKLDAASSTLSGPTAG